MSDITDVVKALTELSAQLRAKAKHPPAASPEGDLYYETRAETLHEAAAMVDAVMVGPAIQSALDELDRREHRAALRGEG